MERNLEIDTLKRLLKESEDARLALENAEHSMQQELRDHQQQMASLQQALDQAERAKTALSHQVKCCVLMLVARAPPLGQCEVALRVGGGTLTRG